MRVLVEGHKYELSNFVNDGTNQVLQFIHKEKVGDSDVLTMIANGTTNEEVLEVLIDRITNLNSKFPCRENTMAIEKLDEALMWLNKRTQDRLKRNVEGKHLA